MKEQSSQNNHASVHISKKLQKESKDVSSVPWCKTLGSITNQWHWKNIREKQRLMESS